MNTRFVNYHLAESAALDRLCNRHVVLALAFSLGALTLWCMPDIVAWLCGSGVVTL